MLSSFTGQAKIHSESETFYDAQQLTSAVRILN